MILLSKTKNSYPTNFKYLYTVGLDSLQILANSLRFIFLAA